MMRRITQGPARIASAATARDGDTLERWLDRTCHGLMLVKNEPALKNVRAKRVKPWRKIADYLRLLPDENADAVILTLYRHNAMRRGRDLPPTGGSAA